MRCASSASNSKAGLIATFPGASLQSRLWPKEITNCQQYKSEGVIIKHKKTWWTHMHCHEPNFHVLVSPWNEIGCHRNSCSSSLDADELRLNYKLNCVVGFGFKPQVGLWRSGCIEEPRSTFYHLLLYGTHSYTTISYRKHGAKSRQSTSKCNHHFILTSF